MLVGESAQSYSAPRVRNMERLDSARVLSLKSPMAGTSAQTPLLSSGHPIVVDVPGIDTGGERWSQQHRGFNGVSGQLFTVILTASHPFCLPFPLKPSLNPP